MALALSLFLPNSTFIATPLLSQYLHTRAFGIPPSVAPALADKLVPGPSGYATAPLPTSSANWSNEKRQAQPPGTDWVTATVYVTLAPGALVPTPSPTPTPDPNLPVITVFVTVQPTPTPTYYYTPPISTYFYTPPTSTWTDTYTYVSPSPQPITGNPYYSPVDDNECFPGDSDETEGGVIKPTHTQAVTLYVIAIYIVAGLVAWNFFGIRSLIYPAKLTVVAWHELGHAVLAVGSGARLEVIKIDPNEGGIITVTGGVYPLAALPGGFIFSILIGGLLVFAGFNTLASKVASFVLGISLLTVSWWTAGLMSKAMVFLALGLMIGLWFIDHASGLRFYILFYGVLSSMYVLFDTVDDLVFRKMNPCCARLHWFSTPRVALHTWAGVWFGVSWLMLILFIIAALCAFRQTPHAMFCQSQAFLGT